jgi:exopolysaccharide biosynthesis polyprenyl glycosylphosphotransferase
MFRRFSLDFAIFAMFLDGLLVALALALASYLRPLLGGLPFAVDLPEVSPIPFSVYLLFSILWVLVLVLFSVYDARRNLHVVDEMASLALGSLLAGVSLAGVLYLSFRDISRVLFLSFLVLAFLLLLLWRLLVRIAFRWQILRGVQERRVLIVGAGKVGKEFERRVYEYETLGLRLVGFLDDDAGKRVKDKSILGRLDELSSVICEKKIDDVVFALPRRAYESLNRLTAELHCQPVRVWVIPDYFALALHQASVEEFAGIPMLDLRAPALSDYQRSVKRVFDLVLTIGAMPLVLPLMGVIAVAIRLDSPGPVLFLQKRAGENGRLFEMYKFRTMVQNADAMRLISEYRDEQGNPIHKMRNDPRVTRVGRFLRRTSLDELPQLFNVLKGEMSVVGPRPELPFLVDHYELWQRKRFAVPQGITGWWQVNGRSDKPMHLHTEDDLYYVQHYSLWLDLEILLKTILVVLRGGGAY